MAFRENVVAHWWGWAFSILCVLPVVLTLDNTSANPSNNDEKIIVELAIVCDKEFGDLFQHNRERILEYWAVFLEDLGQRFRSLPSSNVSFRVTSVTTISSTDNQPFIENVRNENGSIKLTSVIHEFAKWAYRKRDNLPKFDVAMAVTAASLEGYAVGVAYGKGACLVDHRTEGGRLLSVVVIGDRATWSVGAAAHELGHLVGASHDVDTPNCNQTGFIMSGTSLEKQYFFSSCSDNLIYKFLKSNQTACLKKINNHENEPVLLPVSKEHMPSMEKQCQRLLNNTEAFIYRNGASCQQIKCAQRHKVGFISIDNHLPVDGTSCKYENGNGQCVRGTCLPVGLLLKHPAMNMCLSQKDSFAVTDIPVMVSCPIYCPMTIDLMFLLSSGEHSNRKLIAAPYLVYDSSGIKIGLKCLQARVLENHAIVEFVDCEEKSNSAIMIWDLKDDNGRNFILSHAITGWCLGYNNESSQIVVLRDCVGNRQVVTWKLQQDFRSDGVNDYESSSHISLDKPTSNNKRYFIMILCTVVAFALVVTFLLFTCFKWQEATILKSTYDSCPSPEH